MTPQQEQEFDRRFGKRLYQGTDETGIYII